MFLIPAVVSFLFIVCGALYGKIHLTPDMINGLFEFCGSLFLFRNCLMLYRDKAVKGVSILSVTYFFTWGVWNLFFFPSQHLLYSLCGGLFIMTANSLWILMSLYYTHKEKRDRIIVTK